MVVHPGWPAVLWPTRNRRIGAVAGRRRATPLEYFREILGAARKGLGVKSLGLSARRPVLPLSSAPRYLQGGYRNRGCSHRFRPNGGGGVKSLGSLKCRPMRQSRAHGGRIRKLSSAKVGNTRTCGSVATHQQTRSKSSAIGREAVIENRLSKNDAIFHQPCLNLGAKRTPWHSPSGCYRITRSRHSMRSLRPMPDDRDRPESAVHSRGCERRLSDRKADKISRGSPQVSLRPAGHVAPGIVGANFSVRGVPPLDLMPSKGQTPRNLNRSIVGLTYGQETKTCHGSLWRVLQPA
jgi:hypothetical protein